MKKNIICTLIAAAMLPGMIPPESFNTVSGNVLSVRAAEENSGEQNTEVKNNTKQTAEVGASENETATDKVTEDKTTDVKASENETAEDKVTEDKTTEVKASEIESAEDKVTEVSTSENEASADKTTEEQKQNITASGACGENVNWSLDQNGTITFYGQGKMYDYLGYDSVPWREWQDSIVKAVFEEGVESIGDYVFYSFHNLMEISISKTVKSIGDTSFYWCTSLQKVVIPEGVKSIKSNAFGHCTYLSDIEFPDSLTDIQSNFLSETMWVSEYYADKNNSFLIINGNLLDSKVRSGDILIPDGVVNIADNAFSGKAAITGISMPDSVKRIGSRAFSGCSNLSDIRFSENLESIRGDAFTGTKWFNTRTKEDDFVIVNGFLLYVKSQNGDVVIPDNVTYICDSAFERCNGITSVMIPDSVEYIGEYAFFWCENITDITLPKNLVTIAAYAFGNCFNLKSIILPDGLKNIGEYAFYQCSSLNSIDIPESVENIDGHAFCLCSNLKELYIPKNVCSIGTNIVLQDYSLQKITVSKENPFYCDIDGVLFNSEKTHLLAYPGNKTDKSYSVPEGVTDIRTEAFSSTKLEELYIPESVEYIWNEAFRISSHLKNIRVAENNKAYSDIDGILCDKDGKTLISYALGREDTSFKIPDGIETIGKYAFFTSRLSEITLPDSLKIISDYGFANCSDLTEIEIPEGCIQISYLSFLNNFSLSKIIIPESVTTIGNYAFESCNKITVYGYTESYAEKYANQNKIPFVDITLIRPAEKLTGDLSGDGTVSVSDLVVLINILLSASVELSDEELNAADLNGDGKVNIIDLIYLKQILLGE